MKELLNLLQEHVKEEHNPDPVQGLQEHHRDSQEHTKDRRGLVTGSEGPDATSKTSFETTTPGAKAVANAARAAACQVIMTPGGPLPSPAGCPGHADFHAAVSGHDVRAPFSRLRCSALYCVFCFSPSSMPACNSLAGCRLAFPPCKCSPKVNIVNSRVNCEALRYQATINSARIGACFRDSMQSITVICYESSKESETATQQLPPSTMWPALHHDVDLQSIPSASHGQGHLKGSEG